MNPPIQPATPACEPDVACQHFAAATELLAGSGSVKDRLLAAYYNELSQLDVTSLPYELRGDYSLWYAKMHRERPLRGEDAVRATLRKISGAEADRLAQLLVRISLRMMQIAPPNNELGTDTRLKVGVGGAVVQLFPS